METLAKAAVVSDRVELSVCVYVSFQFLEGAEDRILKILMWFGENVCILSFCFITMWASLSAFIAQQDSCCLYPVISQCPRFVISRFFSAGKWTPVCFSQKLLVEVALLLSAAPVAHNWSHLWIRWNSGLVASSQNPRACYFLCFFPLPRKTVTSALVSSLSLSLSFPVPEREKRSATCSGECINSKQMWNIPCNTWCRDNKRRSKSKSKFSRVTVKPSVQVDFHVCVA